MRRSVTFFAVLFLVAAMALPAFAAKGGIPGPPGGDTTTTTQAPSDDALSCADDPLAAADPSDGDLVLSADDGFDCNDIGGVDNGATFTFEYTVTGGSFDSFHVLGIRNSIPGDWCGGLFAYHNAEGEVLFGGEGNAVRPRGANDGDYVTLVIDEVFVDGNCTNDGVLNWYDDDATTFALSLTEAGGKPLKGNTEVTVTWCREAPPCPTP